MEIGLGNGSHFDAAVKTLRSRWINLLWLSISELENILSGTGWGIHRLTDDGRMYVVILTK